MTPRRSKIFSLMISLSHLWTFVYIMMIIDDNTVEFALHIRAQGSVNFIFYYILFENVLIFLSENCICIQ